MGRLLDSNITTPLVPSPSSNSVEPNPPSSRAAGLLVCAPRSALPSWPVRVRQRRPAGLSSVVADGDVLGRLGTSWPSAPSAYSVLLLSSERVRRADPRGSIDEHQAGRQSSARLNGNAVRPPARTETKRSQPRGRSGHTARMPTPGCFWAIGARSRTPTAAMKSRQGPGRWPARAEETASLPL